MIRKRKYLLLLGMAVSGSLSGCFDTSDDSKFVRPESDPATVPEPLICDEYEEFVRCSRWVDEENIRWGRITNEEDEEIFSLNINKLKFERGEMVKIVLVNRSDEEQTTANGHKFNFDVYTEDGWQEVRGFPEGMRLPINDDRWGFAPGESYEWKFRLTESGVIKSGFDPHEDDLVICPRLPAGRYRFATSAPDSGDLAVAFDLVE